MTRLVNTNFSFHPDHRDLLDSVSRYNGWSLRETVVRGVRLLGELMELYRAKAADLEDAGHDDHADLLRRVAKDLGLELLINREIELGTNEADGSPALRVGEISFVESPEGELLAIRDVGVEVEVSLAKNGHLTVIGVYPRPGSPALN
jgi:hypothetical protein